MKQKFLDQLDGGWGDLIADTYKKANPSFVAEVGKDSYGYGYDVIEKRKYNLDDSIVGSVIIPNHVKEIETAAFAECKNIKEISFPQSLLIIGQFAFEQCIGLENLKLNNGLKNILFYAFSECKNLKTIDFGTTLHTIAYSAFENCGLEGDLVLPDSLIRMESNVFENCKNLNGTLTLGKNLFEIREYCFYGCNFTGELYIPKSVELIGKYAFGGCKFSTIYVNRMNESNWDQDWNKGCDADIEYYF